jgi:predicted SAM-dependent methyltransferase
MSLLSQLAPPLLTKDGPLRRRLRRFVRKRQVRRFLANHPRPYRLHLGCGKVRLENWINLDGDPAYARADVYWDLHDRLPFPAGSCELIHSEHVLEHLDVATGTRLLRECHRILQPGGTVRIAMPSLDEIIAKSASGEWKDQDWLTWPGFKFIKTRAEMLNIAFRWWDHRWLYDREELHRRLKEAGFTSIRDMPWRQSQIESLCNLETRKDSLLICEAQR